MQRDCLAGRREFCVSGADIEGGEEVKPTSYRQMKELRCCYTCDHYDPADEVCDKYDVFVECIGVCDDWEEAT